MMHLKTKTEEKLLSASLILVEYWIESVFIFLSINSSKRLKTARFAIVRKSMSLSKRCCTQNSVCEVDQELGGGE